MAYQDIIANFQAKQDAANAANQKRYEEAIALYSDIVEQYKPGGAFGAGFEAQLDRQKTKTVAGQTQSLVSSGLFGTSVTAGLGQKFEEEVGMPARLKLEDIRMGRYAEAISAKAGLIERREDVGPDYGMIAQLSAQAASRPQTGSYQAPPDPNAPGGYNNPYGWKSTTKSVTQPKPVSTGIVYGSKSGYKAPIPYHAAGTTGAQQTATAKQRYATTGSYYGTGSTTAAGAY